MSGYQPNVFTVDWRADLQAWVFGLTYDFGTHDGCLYMAHGSCVDMTATIALFTRIDPNVRRIQTFSDGKIDTLYVRGPKDIWQAVPQ